MKFRGIHNPVAGLQRIVILLSLFAAPFACSGELPLKDSGGSETAAAAPTKELGESSAAAQIEVAKADTNTADTPYTVECGQVNDEGEKFCLVDKKTYIGWRTYHAFCHVCHAQDAVGSTFAPSLVDSLQDIDKERFLEMVNDGYTGQVGVMPPWKDNPNVSKRYEELYSYLKARSDGVLSRGRPKKMPGSK